MAKIIDGKLVVREGKCIDCGVPVFVFEGGSRSDCDCNPKPLTLAQRQQKEWMEKTFNPRKK